MELRLLAYFVTVADELGFGRAATRLFVTTPTVSAGIRDLERSLGVRLFDRTPRSVALTPAGRALLPQARRVLDDADGVRALADDLAGRRRVVAGTFLGLGARLLEDAARVLQAVGGQVDLRLRVYGFDGPARHLCSGEVDLAVLVGPSASDDQLVRVPLATEPRLAVVPSTHPLAAHGSLALAEVDALSWVPFPSRDEVWKGWWRLDDARGSQAPQAAGVHEDPHELLLAVRNGEGTATALAPLRDQFSYSGLALRPVDGVPRASVDVAVRRDRQDGTLRRFVEALLGAADVPAPQAAPDGRTPPLPLPRGPAVPEPGSAARRGGRGGS